ncbi:MAG: site-specific integrase [Candidatus Pacearchaeota archaeon]
MDIHNYKRRLERIINQISRSNLSEENKKLIMQFHDNCFTESLSLSKIERYLYDLFHYAIMLNKNLMDATREDIKSIVAEIEKKEWSPHTKHAFKVMIRKFYKSMEGIDEKGVYPERVKWLHSNVKNSQLKSSEELITESDVKKMISFSLNCRDKALISTLYESGCRISELGLIKFKDVVFDQYGAVMNVTGKTGPRRVRLVISAPYLQDYINKHWDNQNINGFVWTKLTGDRSLLGYSRLTELIKRTAERAGIKKRIHAHLFRHSRATFLANKLTEAQMKQYLGWTQSSKMAAVYVHMSGRDTEDAILSMNGLKLQEKENQIEELKPKLCVRCNKQRAATERFCPECGLILDEDEARKIIQSELDRNKADEIMNQLVKDPEILELIKKKLS